MSLQYGHYLVPTELGYIPNEADLENLLVALSLDGWVDDSATIRRTRFPPSNVERANLNGPTDVVRDIVECLEAGYWQRVEFRPKELPKNDDPDDGRVFWQMPKGTVLSTDWCWGASIHVSAKLRLLPLGEAPATLPCPSCHADLTTQLGLEDSPEVDEAMQQCRSCGEGIDLHSIVRVADAVVTDCPEIREPAPFFRFMLSLTSDSPPEDPATTDPKLLDLIRSSTGVSFRAFGRWF